MNPRQTALDVVSSLPPDCSWDEVLRALRSAAGYTGGPEKPGGAEEAREVGPAWAVEQAAEPVPGEPTMRSYDVVVERDEEGWFVGSVPGLQGCHTQARSLEQLLERVREAIALCLDDAGGGGTTFVGIRRVTVAA